MILILQDIDRLRIKGHLEIPCCVAAVSFSSNGLFATCFSDTKLAPSGKTAASAFVYLIGIITARSGLVVDTGFDLVLA